jgi:hypothetical protein
MISRSLGLIVLVFLCLFSFSRANATTIRVKVIDGLKSKVLEGASITLKGPTEHNGVTDKDGSFQFKDIGTGKYTVTCFFVGFGPPEEKIIVVKETDQTIEIEFVLMEETKQLVEVLVAGKSDQETDIGARLTERISPNIMNVLSGAAIQLSPDMTLANVAQRISGVTLVRNGLGDGQYAIIRGIDPRYNNTLINGIKIPSPDPANRFIPLDIIPAQLLQRTEVTKALTPDMEGDAIGGTINAVLKDAPEKAILAVSASTGYSQLLIHRKFLYFDKGSINFRDPNEANGGTYYAAQTDFNNHILLFSPRQAPLNDLFAITAGRRFFHNRLGALLSVTNQNTYKSANSVQNVTVTSAQNLPVTTNIISRDYYTQQVRTGINAKIDYELNDGNKLEAYGLFLRMNDIQTRYITDTIFNDPGRYGPGSGKVATQSRERFQQQTVENATVQGNHSLFSALQVNWSGVYSRAVYQVPDMAEINTYHTVKTDGTFDGASDYLNNVTHSWQKSNDRDFAGYLNLTYTLPAGALPVTLKGGGLFRAKDRNNYQNDYNLLPVLVKDSRGIPQNPPFTGIENAGLYVYQPVGNPQFNTSNYTAAEKITSAYVQGKTEWGKLKVLAGTRLEITSQSNRNQTPSFPGYIQHYFDYHDWLPSLHLTYELKERQNLRFSVFKSISRPNYFELVDYTIKGDQFNVRGNPALRHVRSTSYDARYEWYLNTEDVIQAGIFYKKIIDPIEILLETNGGQPQYKPINSGTATNYGFELVLIKYFNRIGFSANYTFTNSTIASPKLYYYSSNGTSVDSSRYINEKRPLQGQSRHVANASILYKGQAFKCQLALIYQGKRIAQVSQYYALDFYQTNYVDLSFSAEQTLKGKLSIFCKLNNLLNTPYRLATKSGYLYQRDIYQQSYLLGVRYQL